MTPMFTINFRREAYQREVARARRRVMAVGLWAAYFGVILVLLGLYGLNCASLARRVQQIERQTARLRASQGARADWSLRPAELAQLERYAANPRQWRDRLVRLSELLPPNAQVVSLAVNPQNLTHALEQNKLVISGVLRSAAGQDRMESVMRVVNVLHRDSVFAAGYQNVKLASTRIAEGGHVEFVIECR
jgi:Tfp pilus assembly protein PilN